MADKRVNAGHTYRRARRPKRTAERLLLNRYDLFLDRLRGDYGVGDLLTIEGHTNLPDKLLPMSDCNCGGVYMLYDVAHNYGFAATSRRYAKNITGAAAPRRINICYQLDLKITKHGVGISRQLKRFADYLASCLLRYCNNGITNREIYPFYGHGLNIAPGYLEFCNIRIRSGIIASARATPAIAEYKYYAWLDSVYSSGIRQDYCIRDSKNC